VVADTALDEGGRRVPCTAVPVSGATRGPILTVAAPLLTAADKAVRQACGALAVETEAYPVATWAATRGVPFVHARIILDAVDQSLPDLDDAVDSFGQIQFVTLARRLLLRPALTVSLMGLARQTRALEPALGTLARQVRDLLLAARRGD